jgi:hypothetical protein
MQKLRIFYNGKLPPTLALYHIFIQVLSGHGGIEDILLGLHHQHRCSVKSSSQYYVGMEELYTHVCVQPALVLYHIIISALHGNAGYSITEEVLCI